jgi:hypothetical protein
MRGALFAVCVAWALCAHARPAHDSAAAASPAAAAQSRRPTLRPSNILGEVPTDPNNTYLSFRRFRAGGRTHVIRFSGPCT